MLRGTLGFALLVDCVGTTNVVDATNDRSSAQVCIAPTVDCVPQPFVYQSMLTTEFVYVDRADRWWHQRTIVNSENSKLRTVLR